MKKSLLFLLFGSFFGINLIAQPVITASGVNPAVGDQVPTSTANYVSPGNAGASQTWDLSTMSATGSSTITFVTPSSTPYLSSFPTSNVATSTGGAYAYYKTSSTAWQNMGVVNGGVTIAYSNAEDLLHFPFTFNNTYNDTWAANFSNGGITFYRTGTTTVTADSYGTLITPAGTFSNVLRVHFVQVYQDSADVAGNPYIIDYQNDEYMWYLNGNHQPVALVYMLTSTAGNFQGGSYLTTVQGLNEPEALVSYDLFPNPSVDNLTISINLKQNEKVEVKLFNSIGSEIAKPVSGNGLAGLNEYSVSLLDLPEGVYFAEVFLNGSPGSVRRFVISK